MKGGCRLEFPVDWMEILVVRCIALSVVVGLGRLVGDCCFRRVRPRKGKFVRYLAARSLLF